MADQGTQGLLSPWLRRHRLRMARPWLRGQILDYGCGSGALAEMVAPADYTGYDVDALSVEAARRLYPQHRFTAEQPAHVAYDTVVSLAVIEHMKDPDDFLAGLAASCKQGGHIVVTTPNPFLDPAHHVGAAFGLFSHDASEEHVSLLNRKALMNLAESLHLQVIRYSRFLFGANQLLVLRK